MSRDPYEIRHLIPLRTPPAPSGRRTRDHRCGRCAWGGTGSLDCENYRPLQTSPQVDPDGPEAA